jgi:hypothetical protein
VEPDALLRRVERTAIVLCGAMAAGAVILWHGSPSLAVAVLAGGLLAGVSYWLIKAGVSGVLNTTLSPQETATPQDSASRAPRWRIALQLAGRYALLALLAYVMIARLRLHPLGLLAGASSIVAAVTVEAVRVLVKRS